MTTQTPETPKSSSPEVKLSSAVENKLTPEQEAELKKISQELISKKTKLELVDLRSEIQKKPTLKDVNLTDEELQSVIDANEKGVINQAKDMLSKIGENISKGTKTLVDNVTNPGLAAESVVNESPLAFTDKVGKVFDGIKSFFADFSNNIVEFFKKLFSGNAKEAFAMFGIDALFGSETTDKIINFAKNNLGVTSGANAQMWEKALKTESIQKLSLADLKSLVGTDISQVDFNKKFSLGISDDNFSNGFFADFLKSENYTKILETAKTKFGNNFDESKQTVGDIMKALQS